MVRKAQIASLLTIEVKILNKDLDYIDVFLKEKAAVLSEIIN